MQGQKDVQLAEYVRVCCANELQYPVKQAYIVLQNHGPFANVTADWSKSQRRGWVGRLNFFFTFSPYSFPVDL